MTQEKEVEAGFRPVECKCCGDLIRSEEQAYHGDEGSFYAGEPVCETCYYEDEPCATVHYGNGGPESCGEDFPYTITGTRNETEGDFQVEWHSTDPWRGYYEAKSERYVQVFTDAILSGHESEQMLKRLNDLTLEAFKEKGVDYARVFCRSSNVFFTSFEVWVRKGQKQLAEEIIRVVKEEVDFDNPLYSTGILIDRETVEKAKEISGVKEPRSDWELLSAVYRKLAEKGLVN